jgi:hypothetical protein
MYNINEEAKEEKESYPSLSIQASRTLLCGRPYA